MTDTASKPTVFISYSHKDEIWKDRFIPQLRALEQAGRIVVWDDRKIDGGDKWYPEIMKAMEEALVAVCIISPDYLASAFCVKEEVPFLLQRCERDGMIFMPLLLRPCAWKAFEWLKEIQMLPRDGKNVVVDFRGIEDAVFADVANLILEIADNPTKYKQAAPPAPLWSPAEKVDIDRLPTTGAELFGRQKELEMLDAAWASDTTNVVSLVAWGGVGKSTLVNKWLERLQAENYRGARRVYAWSFYSQGTGERVTSADLFINAALQWFGDPDPAGGSPWDKGERLARLVQREKILLLLDGLEPLQSPHAHERGKIKDPALVTLITELARNNSGLCLITTREQVVDLDEFKATVLHKDLEQISDEAGRALLRVGGVQGTDAELEGATRAFGNHALAVNLLAVYLRDVSGHRIAHAVGIPDLDIPEKAGKHPRRLLAAFARRFADGPEVQLLRLLGLFDRPADSQSLEALRSAPPVYRLTDHLHSLSEADWLRLIEKLCQKKLLAPAGHDGLTDLDAHPLVREHFGQELKQGQRAAWREGNNRLYEHLKRTAKQFPDTLEEMAPLYAAIVHGCEAGKYQDALDVVYRLRVLRRGEFFSTRRLGAFGADLAVLSGFFLSPWDLPVADLNDDWKSMVLNLAGFYLKAIGHLEEAVQPMRLSFDATISLSNWKLAAMRAANLTEVYLTIGDLGKALDYAIRGVRFADRSGHQHQRRGRKINLAETLHQLGYFQKAGTAFRQAEEMQKLAEPQLPLLHSLWGWRYCNLLLDQEAYGEVQIRIEQTSKWDKAGLLSTALEQLSLGRALIAQVLQEGTRDFAQAARSIGKAVDGLRQAGTLDFLPYGLLARAELFRVEGEFERALTDLEEAMRITTRGSMGLQKADCHLEYVRLYLAMSEKEAEIKQEQIEKAREHWANAKEMIERMGYHRRDKDLQEIEAQLAQTS